MNVSDSFKIIASLFLAHLDRNKWRPSKHGGSKVPRDSKGMIRERRKRQRQARRRQRMALRAG